MNAWTERPRDEAHLFNPAFCGMLLHQALKGYGSIASTGMPFPLVFLVLPLVLHKATREKIPKRLSASGALASWSVTNPETKIQFAHRVSVMKPITREALLFLFRAACVEIYAEHNLIPIGKKIKDGKEIAEESDEISDCIACALFVGRWLASAGTPQSIYAILGVRP